MAAEPICQLCLADGERHILQKSSYGDWACPFCGVVDDKVTSAANTVDVTATRGAVVDGDETLEVKEQPWSDWKEANFMKSIDRLLYIYLADPQTCLLAKPAPKLIPAAKRLYIQIRDADLEVHGYAYKVVNGDAKKVRYHLAMAVRRAAQNSNVEYLARLRDPRFGIVGGIHGDGDVATPTLTELIERGRRLGPGHEAYFDSFPFLILQYRNYAKHLNWDISLKDSMLCEVNIICTTLRRIANLSHDERLKILKTQPDKREWEETDWDHLREIDWDLVMDCANGLYQAQQCVSLWSPRCSPPIAIALTIAAIQASNGRTMPQIHLIEKELGAVLGTSRFTTSERHVEIKKFLVGWSTSFPDAGIPIPMLSKPKRGGYGNGLTHYESDAKKAVPEMEIAALSAQVLWKDWRKVMHARLRLNAPVRPYEAQLTKARKMFVSVTPPVIRRLKRNPDGTFQKHDKYGNLISDSATSSRTHTRAGSESGDSVASTSQSSRSTSAAPSSTAPSSRSTMGRSTLSASPIPPITPISFEVGHDYPEAGPSRLAPPANRQVRRISKTSKKYDLANVNPDLDIEALLANADHSSDEDYDKDSDDEGPNDRVVPDIESDIDPALGLSNVIDRRPGSVIGFSIGPDGFRTEVVPPSTPRAQSTYPLEAQKRRSQSVLSDVTAGESGSEVERILKRSRSELSTTPVPRPPPNVTVGRRISKNKARQSFSTPGPSIPMSKTNPKVPIPDANRISRASSIVSTVPSGATTPLKALTSLSPSPSPMPLAGTTARSLQEPESDSHIGVLYRDREAYILVRASDLRKQGQIVTSEVEAAMFKWIAEQRLKGALPRIISTEYLEGLGIKDDVHEIDLQDFVESKKSFWSPVESLLRIGIKPSEIPPHYVIHSLLHLNLLLHHYSDRDRYLLSVDEGEEREDDQDFLFSNDRFDDYFLSEIESQERLRHIMAEGTWDDLPSQPQTGRKVKKETKETVRHMGGEGLWRTLEALGEGKQEEVSDGIQEAIVDRIAEKRRLRSNTKTVTKKRKRGDDEDEEDGDEDDLDLDIGEEMGEFGLFSHDGNGAGGPTKSKKGKTKGKGKA